MATNNSMYQLLPDAVGRQRRGAERLLTAEERLKALTFSPRGGGIGTNGQLLTTGIMVDMSRHLNFILDINVEQGWVRVEAGVIKELLFQYLRPYGYFFSPELSTSNPATLGGVINTYASGQGSLVYGKTSKHVLGLRAVLLGSEMNDIRSMPTPLALTIALEETAEGSIYHWVLNSCRDRRTLIMEKFSKLYRFLTGYDLCHVLIDTLQT